MKIAVLGAGAMGSLYGGYLSQGNEVFMVDIWRDHVDAINADGLKIEEAAETRVFHPKAVTDAAQVGVVDLVIVFVKSIMTTQALEGAKGLIGPQTVLLSLQNGYGNADDMLAFAPQERVLVGTTGHGCTMRGPGHVYHAGFGATHIGAVSQDQSKAEEVARLLEAAGFDTHASAKVMELVWRKVFVNTGINAICALLDVTNSAIKENPFASELSRLAVLEAVAVANRDGMDFHGETEWANVLEVAQLTGKNRCSMLADVSAARRTEIEKINGAVLKKALALGMAAPYNQSLTLLIQAKEQEY